MPGIFGNSVYTDTLENGVNELEGNAYQFNKPIKDAVFYFDTSGAGEIKLQVSFWNSGTFMKYHDMKEDDLNINISVGDSAEYGLKVQEFFKEPIYGLKSKIVRVSGTGDVPLTTN
jgi:hypothetical protein